MIVPQPIPRVITPPAALLVRVTPVTLVMEQRAQVSEYIRCNACGFSVLYEVETEILQLHVFHVLDCCTIITCTVRGLHASLYYYGVMEKYMYSCMDTHACMCTHVLVEH